MLSAVCRWLAHGPHWMGLLERGQRLDIEQEFHTPMNIPHVQHTCAPRFPTPHQGGRLGMGVQLRWYKRDRARVLICCRARREEGPRAYFANTRHRTPSERMNDGLHFFCKFKQLTSRTKKQTGEVHSGEKRMGTEAVLGQCRDSLGSAQGRPDAIPSLRQSVSCAHSYGDIRSSPSGLLQAASWGSTGQGRESYLGHSR